MAVIRGTAAAVYLQTSAASSAATGETMTLVSDLWYKAPTAKRMWDKDATVTVYDGVTPITTVQEYDYANGRVRLLTTPAGAVTADFSYFARAQIAGCKGWSLNVTMDTEESGCLGDVAKKPYPTVLSWNLSLPHLWFDTRASYTTACAGDNNDLVYTAKLGGTQGNLISIEYLGGVSQTLGVTVSDKAIVVQLGTSGGGAVTSTATQVRAAVLADADAMRLLESVENAAANDGSGTPAVLAHTHLGSGVDSDWLTRMLAAADLIVECYTNYSSDYRFAGIGHITNMRETVDVSKLVDQPLEITGFGCIFYAEA